MVCVIAPTILLADTGEWGELRTFRPNWAYVSGKTEMALSQNNDKKLHSVHILHENLEFYLKRT